MVQLMTIDQLRKIAAGAGIALEDAPIENANLYVLTDPEGNDIYIGKAASKRRHAEEDSARDLDYLNKIVSGFTALLVENDARRHPLAYDPAGFDPTRLKDHIADQKWQGKSTEGVLERLSQENGAPTPEEVEQILVRIHIRTGRLIGNSQFASQWETPIGTFTDTVAALAADAARVSGTLASTTTVDTTNLDAMSKESRDDA